MRKFLLESPMRCPDGKWAQFLRKVSQGNEDDLPDWNCLKAFAIRVTNDLNTALAFFSDGLNPAERSPPDREWIAVIHPLANESSENLQDWRRDGGAPFVGMVVARSELWVSFPNCHGLSAAHQMDLIHRLETPDRSAGELKLFEGDPFLSLRNMKT
jgi:hypothetical protein